MRLAPQLWQNLFFVVGRLGPHAARADPPLLIAQALISVYVIAFLLSRLQGEEELD